MKDESIMRCIRSSIIPVPSSLSCVYREPADAGLCEPAVIVHGHGDRIAVGAGLEGDLVLLEEGLIGNGGQAEECADGWFCAELAVSERFLEHVFARKPHRAGVEVV